MAETDDLASAHIAETRGRKHPFERIDCRRTAHVVIDMQNGFVDKATGLLSRAGGSLRRGIDLIPRINAVSRTLRTAGSLVVYVQHQIDDEEVARWKSRYDHFGTPDRTTRLKQLFSPGHRPSKSMKRWRPTPTT